MRVCESCLGMELISKYNKTICNRPLPKFVVVLYVDHCLFYLGFKSRIWSVCVCVNSAQLGGINCWSIRGFNEKPSFSLDLRILSRNLMSARLFTHCGGCRDSFAPCAAVVSSQATEQTVGRTGWNQTPLPKEKCVSRKPTGLVGHASPLSCCPTSRCT